MQQEENKWKSKNIYKIAQRAMGAQIVRLNAIASNLANADNIASILKMLTDQLNQYLKQNILILLEKRNFNR